VKGAKLRAHLEDLGYLVLVGGPRCYYVRDQNGQQVGFYDLCDEDAAFRFGWVQNTTGDGRTDCNSWIEFTTELMERES
jgi:hypothetical protein